MIGQLLKPASISASTISCGKRTSPRPPQRGQRPATVSPRVFRASRRTNAPKCCGGTPHSSISSQYFEEVDMEIWTDSQMASIHKMLNPRSLAVIGATPRLQYGGRFLAAALKAKDRVRVYAVNPRYDEIMGIQSYPSVTELPEAPDLVGIVVPYHQVLAALQESHRKGAGSAIVISAGFAERGVDDRRDLQGKLREFARAS